MTVIVFSVIAYFVGYWFGKRAGIAQTMIRLQGILHDLKMIQYSFKQWNEDNL